MKMKTPKKRCIHFHRKNKRSAKYSVKLDNIHLARHGKERKGKGREGKGKQKMEKQSILRIQFIHHPYFFIIIIII